MRDPWVLRPPAYQAVPGWAYTVGPQVVSLCEQVGYKPDPEQTLVLDAIFGVKADGLSAAYETAVICGRQLLKTGLEKQAAIGWLFVTREETVTWSAHLFTTTQEAFRDLSVMFTNVPMLRRRLAPGPSNGIHGGNVNPHIELRDGRRLLFRARTKTGARGLTGDKIILDEAFALLPEHLGSLNPTLTVVPDPQILYGSSAGLANSEVLREIRDRGRAGAPDLAYFEWCARRRPCATDGCEHWKPSDPRHRPGCALDDEGAWAEASPLLGRRRANGTGLTLAKLRKFRNSEPPAEFARERLGWWDESGAEEIFGPDNWKACHSVGQLPRGPLQAFGLAVSEDLSSVSVGAAGLVGERVEVKPLRSGPRTDWIVAAFRDLHLEHPRVPLVVDGRGPAEFLVPKLRRIPGLQVHVAKSDEVLDAFAELYTLVRERRLLVREEYAELEESVDGATTKYVGDRRTLARRGSSSDISVAEGVMLAAWWVCRPMVAPPPPARPARMGPGVARHELETVGF